MRAFDLIQDLHTDGTLRKLLRSGMISTKILLHRDIFQMYERELILNKSKPVAITETADKFGISESHCYLIIRKMECLVS